MLGDLTVMVGAPASGKSTWAHYHKDEYSVVSRDEIRFGLLEENDNYFDKEDLVFKTFIDEIRLELSMGKRVIADATHLNEASRRKLLNAIKTPEFKGLHIRAIYFKVPLVELKKRNLARAGIRCVPDKVLCNMYNKLTQPHINEGFDKILILDEYAEIIGGEF